MKKNSWLAIAMLVILVEMVASQNAPPPGTGTIRGTVTREGTSDPIPDVQIRLWGNGYGGPVISVQQAQALKAAADRGTPFPQDVLQQMQDVLNSAAAGSSRSASPPALTATTDSDGHFVIENVPAGSAEVQAQLQDYFAPPVNGVSTGIAYKPFTVAAKQTAEVHLTLIPGGTISGRLTGSNGKPLPDAMIRVLKESYADGQPILTISSMKTTDDRGDYRLYRVPPGQYFISAQTARSSPRPPDAPTPTREVPIATLDPGVTDLSRAVPVVIKGGEELTGVNLQMMTAVGARIRGKVVSALPAGPVSGGRGGTRPQIATVSMTAHSLHMFGIAAGTVVTANPDG